MAWPHRTRWRSASRSNPNPNPEPLTKEEISIASVAMVSVAILLTTMAPLTKVEIGVKIAHEMLSKLRRDLLAGMDTVSHEQVP
eukprot:scaffold59739_cov71-Phaeocystis_antarctica.AAC.7